MRAPGQAGQVVMLSFLYRLCERDPYQLYQRLEQQAREYVLEMKVRLLRQLSAASKVRTPPYAFAGASYAISMSIGHLLTGKITGNLMGRVRACLLSIVGSFFFPTRKA